MLEVLPTSSQPQRFGFSVCRLLSLVVKVLTYRSQPLQGRVVRSPILYGEPLWQPWPMGLWGNDKPDQKRQAGSGGVGWLRSPDSSQVVRIASAAETLRAKWVVVTDAGLTSSGRPLVHHLDGAEQCGD